MNEYAPLLFLVVIIFVLAAQMSRNRRDFERAQLARIERKVDLVMAHLGISEPAHPMPEVVRHLDRGEMVQAIKVYREQTGAALREARAAVEAIARERGLT